MTKKKKNLVIVESPAKAKTIKKFLGRNYKVEASMGHVRDLPKSKLGIDLEDDFEPNYITIRGKGKTLNKLRKAAKKSDEVFLATDPDREGEAISWHLAYALKLSEEENNRIEFNEITKTAIKNAIKNPRTINKDLVDAQQARRLLDRIVGYRLSPLLWKKVRKGLSAGRVQSVAVKIICEREKEIRNFEEEEYWSLEIELKNENGEVIKADLYRIDNKKFNLKSKEETDQVIEDIKNEEFEIIKVKKRKRRRNPKSPFTTSTLQQRASNKLNFTAKKTMYIAQQLYEGIDVGSEGTVGLISYIRTDSTRLSNEAKNGAKNYILNKFGDKFLKNSKKKSKNNSNAQDAHEAIRPTDTQRTPEKMKKHLSKDQFKLYDLIWKRFVASQMSSALYESISAQFKAGEKYKFRVSGSRLLFPGHLILTGKAKEDDIDLPVLNEGDKYSLVKTNPEQHFTTPPPRYSEATLVKTLEEEGIGRPSTYAPTLSTIESRDYVEKEGRYFKPTELGETVTELLTEYFPDVTDIEFTADLEKRLDEIEKGNENWKKILRDFYEPFYKRLENARENMESVQIVEETDEVCEKCGSPMVVKYGRYGKFLACSSYPECKNTKPYLIKTGVDCPECEDGEIIERTSKKGRTFYGCSNYPDCNFMSWNKPVKKPCPECGSLMVEKTTKAKGKHYKCTNKECGHTEKAD
ncbi:DNA topoisomerase-1 [Halanaerobium congolense]|jgi:DNA topoisomerase-1|uniref:DNA topoisomerase 1 n=1 Tax=Halanaerobium congolense TaxID=54121 RepID=A0A1G6I6R6_9FIRM|nr:type I DNA topoisomerase [Halanaerobium congolense]KXS48918.1 MAG: DNA topoisomerase I [Halanaerobium sp. T82-1]OEG62403.1 MAG: DNA topoisomerase I [Halanaerobium sp. MDAL1]PUU91085.1 MAG: DNA topoisomerase I [Halanaerobium sp.]PTX17090.1 DNA topoisomerase-1 [Halanaerobium congolense]PXV69304.1 DNA topoisomerase-1 [Halanaerobium congolense]